MKKLFIILILLMASPAFSAPSNTMSISPSAVDATTITAADENTRNNEISTKYNAHSHTDITQVGNTLSVGDGNAGDKTIQANTNDASKPYLFYDDTNGYWNFSNNGVLKLRMTGSLSDLNDVADSTATSGNVLISDGRNFLSETLNLTDNSDVSDATATAGNILVANGSTFVSKTVSGDCTLASTGAMTCQQYYVGVFSRDISTATGTQSVTGVGFQPTHVIFFASMNTQSDNNSWGFDDGTTAECTFDNHTVNASTFARDSDDSIRFDDNANIYEGNISSLDSDGFTMTWTKTGSPTGTADIKYMAFK